MERFRDAGIRQLILSGLAALSLVAVALAIPAARGDSSGQQSVAAAAEQAKSDLGVPHDDRLLAPHNHNDPRTKNDVSRGLTPGDKAIDPTTDAEKKAAEAYVSRERGLPDPKLTTVAAYPTRTSVPATRYAMAGGCYTLRAPSGGYLTRSAKTLKVAAVARSQASGFYFKATRLGGYLLHTEAGEVTLQGNGSIAIAAKPGPKADWTTTAAGGGFRFDVGAGKAMTERANGTVGASATGSIFQLRTTTGCPEYPEAAINVSGDPHAGVTKYQEVRGFVDAHTHGMAFEFLGGNLHCGRPWHEYGAPYALPNCASDLLSNVGTTAVESVLSGGVKMDPVGWPSFKDWPAPDALLHEGTYYRWLERSWRGGQRLFVNLLVENNKLCQIYPIKHNSCDDMDSIRLQAKDMYAMQDYIDAQFGGPGKGFYRIVKDPYQARQVINSGKMAVVMGVETSIPFGCTFKKILGKDYPACTTKEIDASLDELHDMGVRQMELVNKFDNALAGVAGDAGATGILINAANFLETGSFWAMEHCDPADGESADNAQVTLPDITAGQQDALFGALGKVLGILPALPLYQQAPHCNKRGLTDLGVHTIESMAKRKILFDPDHLSVKARASSMDVIDDLNYSGVLSSHSWSTPDTYPRIYQDGGFITPYAGDSTGFVAKWRRHLGWADPHYYFGFGYGADINGLGAQGSPRGGDVPNRVTYPFKGLGGVTVNQQQTGHRVWDINTDGVAQYGLYPDWIEDLRKVADSQHAGDGDKIVEDMARGAEAYLQMWERTYGAAPDSCRNPALRKSPAAIKRLIRKGMTTTAVLKAVGQPFGRLGTTYTFCAKTASRAKVMTKVTFSTSGKVLKVRFS
ncbi:MAG: hypothetical protein L0H31_01925 [Nocardioidaceae bacterium]|nr:hypothetical protein [Nocardioidaceae bacterium]